MSKKLDFNTVTRPVLELTMMDDERTVINVTAPTEGLVEELTSIAPHLNEIKNSGDAESIAAIYDLTARVMSCNRSGVTVTADELRGKYKINLEALIIFFAAYIEFIDEITNAKN